MPLHNVTVEDSSPLVIYRNFTQWVDSLNGSDYAQYSGPSNGFNSNHNTSEVATVDFPFNGTAIYVFGSTGPDHGNFTVSLIADNNFPPVNDYSLAPANSVENTTTTSFSNDKQFKQLLFSRTGLDQSVPHLISLTNSGQTQFILDYFIVESNIAGSSSTVLEYILDDTAPNFTYNGNWTSVDAKLMKTDTGSQFTDLFNNKTQTFTSLNGSEVVLKFSGSGVAVHGTWALGMAFFASMDGQGPLRVNSPISLSGIYNRPRELIYYMDNLEDKEHALSLVNDPLPHEGLNDLSIDYAVVSTTNLNNVPQGVTPSTVGTSAAASPTQTQSNGSLPSTAGNDGAMLGSIVFFLFMLFEIVHLLPTRRRY